MKKYVIYSFVFFFGVFSLPAQDLYESEVPSVILNNFQSTFPDASDVEWEKKEDQYEVEFEIGYWFDDHVAWYDSEGKLLRHQQEISKKDIPESVYKNIKKDYKWYVITDTKRITQGEEITYRVELRSFIKEWEVLYSETGEVLGKRRD